MHCPSCGFENATAMKSCGECGQRLAETLARAAVTDPRSYTPKHFAEKILSSRAALEGERQQVTVPFAEELRQAGALNFSIRMGAR